MKTNDKMKPSDPTILYKALRENLGAFSGKVFAELNAGDLPEKSKYLGVMDEFAADFAFGIISRGILNVPPRHLKTLKFSVALPAWMLGHNPALKIMIITYGDDLSRDIADKVRRILRTDWYKATFPTRLSADRYAVTDFTTTWGGQVYATSMGGAITGRGADVIIVDDPVKISDAANVAVHEKVAERFFGEILSRLNNQAKGRVLIVGHRLHPEDLSGQLEDSSKWKRLVLPFVADKDTTVRYGGEVWHRKAGELLRPEAYTDADVEELMAEEGPPDFETLYQQNPTGVPWEPLTDEDFPPHKVYIADDAPLVISIDPAQAANSRASCWVAQAWVIVDEKYVLIDQLREQSGYEAMVNGVRQFVRKHCPSLILVEQTSAGLVLADRLRLIRSVPVIEIATPTVGKLDRLKSCIGIIQAGQVEIKDRVLFRDEFIEVTSFPHSDFDDQVDAMTQFLNHIQDHPSVPARATRPAPVLWTATGIRSQSTTSNGIEASDGRGLVASSTRPRWY